LLIRTSSHTCYSYTGSIIEELGFNESLTSNGLFQIPYFDVCMSVSPVTLGSAVALGRTDQSDTQNFTLESSGRLVSEANPEQCITFSGTEKNEGRGEFSVQVMRHCLSRLVMTQTRTIRLGHLINHSFRNYWLTQKLGDIDYRENWI